jgi:hypothetical protein
MKIYMRGAHAALRKQNCYPWRTFVTPLMMTPLFFASVLGARHLVMMGDESFETGVFQSMFPRLIQPCSAVHGVATPLRPCVTSSGGTLWFQDLTVYDPQFILPAIAATLSYTVLEVCGASNT